MPTMWFCKDGRRPHTQSGPGIPITFEEVQAIFGADKIRFVGLAAPNINPEHPSASIKNVVLEVEGSEGITPLLPEQGFYLVVGVGPETAGSKLHAHRSGA